MFTGKINIFFIDYFSANPPMSAVRRLLEMKPNSVKFEYVNFSIYYTSYATVLCLVTQRSLMFL